MGGGKKRTRKRKKVRWVEEEEEEKGKTDAPAVEEESVEAADAGIDDEESEFDDVDGDAGG